MVLGTGFVAIIKSLIPVLLFAGIAYFNALLLIPFFFNKSGYVWYALIVIGILVLVPGIFVLSGFGEIESAEIQIFGKNTYGEIVNFSRTPEQIRFTFTLLLTGLMLFISSAYRLSIDFTRNEKEKQNAEIRYLRTQLNPHFFLNALNNLNSLIRTNKSQSEKYISSLAEMMRYITYDCNKARVCLSDELKYIENYIYFQQIKDDDIHVEVQKNIENDNFKIEPMLLMPFVENAFKFGYFSTTLPEQSISITISQDQSKLTFICENPINLVDANTENPDYSGVGIKNVKERLNISYSGQYKLKYGVINNRFVVNLELWN
jgi:LytS/YehU family sensor histidine kinase